MPPPKSKRSLIGDTILYFFDMKDKSKGVRDKVERGFGDLDSAFKGFRTRVGGGMKDMTAGFSRMTRRFLPDFKEIIGKVIGETERLAEVWANVRLATGTVVGELKNVADSEAVETLVENVNQANRQLGLTRKELFGVRNALGDLGDFAGVITRAEVGEAFEGLVNAGQKNIEVLKVQSKLVAALAKTTGQSADEVAAFFFRATDQYQISQDQVILLGAEIQTLTRTAGISADTIFQSFQESSAALGVIKAAGGDVNALLGQSAQLQSVLASAWGDQTELVTSLTGAIAGNVEEEKKLIRLTGLSADELMRSAEAGTLTQDVLTGMRNTIGEITDRRQISAIADVLEVDPSIISATISSFDSMIDQNQALTKELANVTDGTEVLVSRLEGAQSTMATLGTETANTLGQFELFGLTFNDLVGGVKELDPIRFLGFVQIAKSLVGIIPVSWLVAAKASFASWGVSLTAGTAGFTGIAGAVVSIVPPLAIIAAMIATIVIKWKDFMEGLEFFGKFEPKIREIKNLFFDLKDEILGAVGPGTGAFKIFSFWMERVGKNISFLAGAFARGIGFIGGILGSVLIFGIKETLKTMISLGKIAGAVFGLLEDGFNLIASVVGLVSLKFSILTEDAVGFFGTIKALIGAFSSFAADKLLALVPDSVFGKILALVTAPIEAIKQTLNAFVVDPLNLMLAWDPPAIPGGTFGNIIGVGAVPQLQAGGIVTAPTLAMIGEGGPEAIIPLTSADGFSEGKEMLSVMKSILGELKKANRAPATARTPVTEAAISGDYFRRT